MLLFVLLLVLMPDSVVFLMYVQIIHVLGSVQIAEWPSFGK